MDDMGLSLAQRGSKTSQRVGRSLVNAMPKVLTALTVIGTVAMLWVGGHIFLAGTNTLGWHVLYASVHHAAEWVSGFAGGFGDWFAETALSAVFGLLWGTIVFKTVDGVEWVHGKVTRKKLKSIGTSMMTGIAEDVETPIIRSGEPFMTEDVEDGFAR
jgi:predicted DNA repair protein MutK